YVVWQFEKDQKIPIAGNWTWFSSNRIRWTHFDASGTRLLIAGRQKTGPGVKTQERFPAVPSRIVVELWDLTGPQRLMSTANTAPELPYFPPRLSFHPGQRAFATFHHPQNTPDGIVAILWETVTRKILGRYKGDAIPRIQDGDYFLLDDKDKGSAI